MTTTILRSVAARALALFVCARVVASLAAPDLCGAAPPAPSSAQYVAANKPSGKAGKGAPSGKSSGSTGAAASQKGTGSAAADAASPPTPRRRPIVSKPTEDEVRAIAAEGKKAAVIVTAKGTIRFELLDEEAPVTVANFVKLARAGFYDGLTFHRVVKEPKPFVIQGGDPLGNGMGNPGYMIQGEFSKTLLHVEGAVAMARSADPNSAGCQFYICLAPAPHLDGQYALFGQVVEGLDVVKAILQGDVMSRVTIEARRP